MSTNNPPSSGQNTSPGTNQNCVPGNQTQSPQTRAFVTPLTVMPLAHAVASLSPTPTESPNVGAGEVRSANFQAPQIDPVGFPVVPSVLYNFNQRQFTTSHSPDLPTQTMCGFDDGSGTRAPGPVTPAWMETFNTFVIPRMFRRAVVGELSVLDAARAAETEMKHIAEKWSNA